MLAYTESPSGLTQAARIVAKFGGISEMIRITGHPWHRINNWLRVGVIPEKYRLKLLEVAFREGLDHTPFDYIAYMVVPRGAFATAA